jgi:hypothetical protein
MLGIAPDWISSIFNDLLRGELPIEFFNGGLKPGSRERL